MNKFILTITVALAAGYLLGIPGIQNIMVIATSLYLFTGGLLWMFNRRLPQHFIVNLLMISIGPMALVMLLNVILNLLNGLEGHARAALLLGIVIGCVILGARFLRSKSRGFF